jgi:hypothetical protein
MAQYKNGEEVLDGDVVQWLDGSMGGTVGTNGWSRKGVEYCAHQLRLVRRADAPSAASVDAREILGKDRNGAVVRKGDMLRCACGLPGGKCPIWLTPEHAGHGGGSAVIASRKDALGTVIFTFAEEWDTTEQYAVLVTAAVPEAPATTPAPPPIEEPKAILKSCNPKTCGCEECVAVRREIMLAKHRAEAARLNERYAAFHKAVTETVAERAPGVSVVTDIVSGGVLVGWLSIAGLRGEVHINEGESIAEYAGHRTLAALNEFRCRLGMKAMGRK